MDNSGTLNYFLIMRKLSYDVSMDERRKEAKNFRDDFRLLE
jgi:hypothetical protein